MTSSTASEMASPRLPGLSGSASSALRPVSVKSVGLGVDGGAVQLHQHAPVGLLLVADLDHVDGQVDAEDLAGHRQGAAPLTGAGLGGQTLDARFAVVEGLGDGRVGLVRTRGTHALVLEEDALVVAQAERLFEAGGADQRRGSPDAVDVADLVGDVDEALHRGFLGDQPHGEERGQVVWSGGLARAGVQRGRGGLGKVRRDVVPAPRDPLFVQQVLLLHDAPPSGWSGFGAGRCTLGSAVCRCAGRPTATALEGAWRAGPAEGCQRGRARRARARQSWWRSSCSSCWGFYHAGQELAPSRLLAAARVVHTGLEAGDHEERQDRHERIRPARPARLAAVRRHRDLPAPARAAGPEAGAPS